MCARPGRRPAQHSIVRGRAQIGSAPCPVRGCPSRVATAGSRRGWITCKQLPLDVKVSSPALLIVVRVPPRAGGSILRLSRIIRILPFTVARRGDDRTESPTMPRQRRREVQGVFAGADHLLVSTTLHGEVPKAARLVTPELALIDPVLAATERERLPDPDDTLSRLISVGARPLVPRTAVGSVPPKVDPGGVQPNMTASGLASGGRRRAAPIPPRRFHPPRTARLVVVAVIGSLSMAALLVGSIRGPELGARPATIVEESPRTSSADSGAPVSASTTAAGKPRRPGRTPRQRTEEPAGGIALPRRFAWAPVARASAYRVEFYRRSERILAATTTHAQIVIPARWESGGRVRRLQPGDYRWYVWSIVDGKRAPSAIVQAKLVVS